MDEEMSNEREIRRPSPIARLMGLDMLPCPSVVPKKQKDMESSHKKMSSIVLQEKYASYDYNSPRKSTDEYQEFKDVFVVRETPQVEIHKNQPVQKGMSSLKPSDIDMAFMRQKFMEAKHLSTEETFQCSKEFNDALEVLGSNKDLFLKFLEEPNSLFTKHLQDLKCSPPSTHASHITILKPSKGTKYRSSESFCISEGNAERCTPTRRGDISSSRYHATGFVSHSLKEHNCYVPHKSDSLYAGNTESFQPTRIVVLKPSLEKAHKAAGAPENFQFGLRKHREIPGEYHAEGRDHHKLPGSVEHMGHMTNGSREIAREITKQMRSTGNSGSRKVVASKPPGYLMGESSCVVSDRANMNPEAFPWTPDHFIDCNNSFSPSSYSAKSSVSREARKRLSERWKMSHRIQEVGLDGRRSSTLGEMLALCDREIPRSTMSSSLTQKIANEKAVINEILAIPRCPLGISSKDGWKDGHSRNLPRSKSLPASSLVYENSKCRKRVSGGGNNYILNDVLDMPPNLYLDETLSRHRRSSVRNSKYRHSRPQFYSCGEEDKLSEREIHVNSEELRDRVPVRYCAEKEHKIPELSDDSVADVGRLTEDFSDSCNSAIIDAQLLLPTSSTMLAKDGEFSVHDRNDIVAKGTPINHPQGDSLPSQCEISCPTSPVSSKEVDQPSPVSVLEPPSEEEKSGSGCFEKISADLQELRMQLRLLKMESADTDAEDLDFLISSDEDTGGERNSLLPVEKILESFRDEEERDFSYLLDLLIDFGVHGANPDELFNGCELSEYPVGPDVFDKLERKYSVLVSWSKSERKLLFDLINSILSDIVAPFRDMSQWVMSRNCRRFAREGLVEDVWQMVVQQRKELSGNTEEKLWESRWLDLGKDVDVVGRELERMVNEDLMAELLLELI